MAFGDVFSAGASLVGGHLANQAARSEGKVQRKWLERMSNTEMQRRVTDLRAANLNPMLAVAHGANGASTPTPGQAPQRDIVTPAVSKAMEARMNSALVAKTAQETVKAAAETTESQTRSTMNTAMLKQIAAQAFNLQMGGELHTARNARERAETQNLRQEWYQREATNPLAMQIMDLDRQIKALSIPYHTAQSNAWASPYGQSTRPYILNEGKLAPSMLPKALRR